MDNIIYLDLETYGKRSKDWLTKYHMQGHTVGKKEAAEWLKNAFDSKEALQFYNGEIGAIGWMINNRYHLHLAPFNFQCNQWPVVGHNVKFDLKFLLSREVSENGRYQGNMIECPVIGWDTRLPEQLMGRKSSLEETVKYHLGVQLDKDLKLRIAPWHIVNKIPEQTKLDMMKYLANDVQYLPTLHDLQQKELEENGLSGVMKTELELLPVLVRMELNGLTVNKPAFNAYKQKSEQERDRLKLEIYEILRLQDVWKGPKKKPKLVEAINSPKQVKQALKEYGIIVLGTSEKDIKGRGYVCDLILRYREIFKLTNTYFPKMIDQSKGYDDANATFTVYGDYNQLGAATGRISSDLFQLLPKTGEFRSLFVPSRANRILVQLDMSQIEPRILGHYVGPGAYVDFLNSVEDVYLGLCQRWNAPQARSVMKNIILGVIYDKQPSTISTELKIPLKEAENWVNLFYTDFPEVKTWVKSVTKFQNKETHKCTLETGHFRVIDKKMAKRTWKGAAINYMVQGLAAHLNKKSLIRLDKDLREYDRILNQVGTTKLIATIHDEVLIDCAVFEAKLVAEIVEKAFKETHEQGLPGIPIKCEAKIIEHWGQAL